MWAGGVTLIARNADVRGEALSGRPDGRACGQAARGGEQRTRRCNWRVLMGGGCTIMRRPGE